MRGHAALGLLAVVLATPSVLVGQAGTRTYSADAVARAAGMLRVSIQRGAIQVRPSPDDAVHLSVRPSEEASRLAGAPPHTLVATDTGIALTISPEQASEIRAVAVEIAVPRGVRYLRLEVVANGDIDVLDHVGELTILTRNGNVVVAGVEGPLLVETRNGAIAAAFDAVRPGMPITLLSRNGEIELTLPEIAGRLSVESRGGTITSAIPLEAEESPEGAPGEGGPQRGTALFSDPGAHVRIWSLNGDVVIRLPQREPAHPTAEGPG